MHKGSRLSSPSPSLSRVVWLANRDKPQSSRDARRLFLASVYLRSGVHIERPLSIGLHRLTILTHVKTSEELFIPLVAGGALSRRSPQEITKRRTSAPVVEDVARRVATLRRPVGDR